MSHWYQSADNIEIKIQDGSYSPIYKKRFKVTNAELVKMVLELKERGIDLMPIMRIMQKKEKSYDDFW